MAVGLEHGGSTSGNTCSLGVNDEDVLALLQRTLQAYEREKAALQAAKAVLNAENAALRAAAAVHSSHVVSASESRTVSKEASRGGSKETSRYASEETRIAGPGSDEHPAFQEQRQDGAIGITALHDSAGEKPALCTFSNRDIIRPLPIRCAAALKQAKDAEHPRLQSASGVDKTSVSPEPGIIIDPPQSAEGMLSSASLRGLAYTQIASDSEFQLPGASPCSPAPCSPSSPCSPEGGRQWRDAARKNAMKEALKEQANDGASPKSVLSRVSSRFARRRSSDRDRQSDKDGQLEVYSVWQRNHLRRTLRQEEEDQGPLRPNLKRTRSNALSLADDDVAANPYSRREQWQKRCGKCANPNRLVIPPAAGRRLAWDLFGLVCITYDLVMIPLGAFDVPSSPGLLAFGLMVTCFWTLDIMFRFFVGYHKPNGLIELRFSRIACRYLRTWFGLDILLVVVDWLVFIGESGADTLGLMRLGKTLRTTRSLKLMRQARLLRLMKVEGNMRLLFDQVNSEKTATIAKMAGLLFFVLASTHFLACGWYALTALEDENSITWVKYHLESDGQKPDWVYLYSTSLHWSITQFTPASMEVYPHNNRERIANVIVVFFALVVFTSLVSSVTSAMTYLNDLSSEETGNKMKLRHWLSENGVSMNLVARVWAAVRTVKRKNRSRMPMKDVRLLAELPKNVMAEVQEEVFRPVFTGHPFFTRYLVRNRASMRRIFNCTVGETSVSLGEELFSEGDPADRMFFVRSGTLYYRISKHELETMMRMPHRSHFLLRGHHCRSQGDWASEVSLWAHWTYRGPLTAASATELITIEGSGFRTIMNGIAKSDSVLCTYANLFAEKAAAHLRTLDIWCDKEASEDIAWKAFQHSIALSDSDSEGSDCFDSDGGSPLWNFSEPGSPWSPELRSASERGFRSTSGEILQ